MKKNSLKRKLFSRLISLVVIAILVCVQTTPRAAHAEAETLETKLLDTEIKENELPEIETTTEAEADQQPVLSREARATGVDKSTLIGNISADIMQDGKPIASGGTLNSKNPIRISVIFPFPIVGDYHVDKDNPSTYIRGGDYAYIELPPLLTLVTTGEISLKFGNNEVGKLKEVVEGGVARTRVDFTDAINEPTLNSASAQFTVDMIYDKENDEDDAQTDSLQIFDKTFDIVIPPKEITVTAEKSGVPDTSNKKILWKVKVNADKEGGTSTEDGKLKGVHFTDNLTGIGNYITGSFKVGVTDVYASADDRELPVIDASGKILSFTFSEKDAGGVNYIGTRYIFFETEIPDAKYYTNGTQHIENTAEIKDKDGTDIASPKAKVTYELKWIEKSGAQVGDGITGGVYDPNNRKITWKVVIDGKMNSAVFTDVLPDGLEYESALLEVYNETSGAYDTPSAISMNVSGQNLSYDMGNIIGKRMITITTKLTNPGETAAKEIVFGNKAKITATGIPGIESNYATVSIGVASVKKSAENYDRKTHTVDWKVALNTEGQTLGGESSCAGPDCLQ